MGRGARLGLLGAAGALAAAAAHDLAQRRHTILRNFPVVGHLRYLLELAGPELRQYIVASNDAERPFTRDQRRWVYATAKRQDPHFGFGTDTDWVTQQGYMLIKPAAWPHPPPADGDPPGWPLPSAKVLGAAHGRRRAFRPASAVNVSGMSFGALGARAVEAMNRGCALAGCLHNTGEGGLSRHHLHGGELIFQIGTGYFGCRDAGGRFSLPVLHQLAAAHPEIRAVEIKVSQGAKPGVGGMLPAAKVTPEIAAARGVPAGQDCRSPGAHAEFGDVPGLLEFVERIADATGLPVGIKSAVGQMDFWHELAERMARAGTGPDFVTIDGGEGGTGAGPLVFTDHVALPFRLAFSRVYAVFAEAGLAERITFIGSAKCGVPENAVLAFALGCDMVNVGREAMLAIGCIQAQRCHTDRCPTGVATHSRWLQHGLDPALKSSRLGNYVAGLRAELISLARTCGVPHPAFLTCEHIEILDGDRSHPAAERFGYRPGWGLPAEADLAELRRLVEALSAAAPHPAEPREVPTRFGDDPLMPS
jgi:glutamate synthase domain-containing protein 2